MGANFQNNQRILVKINTYPSDKINEKKWLNSMLLTSKKVLKKIPFIPSLLTINTLLINKKSYLRSTGYLQSFKKGYPCDENGDFLPWMNFPVIAFLKERLNTKINIFEYGSGYSTRFYAARVNSVTSLEYNHIWYTKVKETLPNNAKLIFQESDIDGQYCRAINETKEQYEMVIIDGDDRENCMRECLNSLSDNGIVLLDDSQREEYSDSIIMLEELGFKRIHFEGLKPKGKHMDRTTIFYRDKNCFGI